MSARFRMRGFVYLSGKLSVMASKRPVRIPMLYRVLAILFALLMIGWMLFVYQPGSN